MGGNGSATHEPAAMPDPSQPFLFISHRHTDRAIADVVRDFVTTRSGGDVTVWQSSSSDAHGPRIAREINRELVNALWRSDVLILIYTGRERDWDYCMWECGVATHPQSEDTRVIVLQCGRDAPRVFADKLAVEVRDPEQVRKFVNEFLTDPDFFPGRHRSITRFAPSDANVQRAAEELHDQLMRVVPPFEDDEVEEWPAVPFLALAFSSSQVASIGEQANDEQAQELTCGFLLEAEIVSADREAARLFDKPTLPSNASFGSILPRAAREQPRPDWLCSLAAQVARAAQWNFPAVRWGLMRSAQNDQLWYGPILTNVRRLPSHAMEFDVHFQRFECPAGAPAITLPLPQDEQRARQTKGSPV